MAPAGAMFCKGCSYALDGIEGGVCPECGRAFDASDRETWDAVPKDRQLRTRARRIGIALLVAGLLVMGIYHSVLPRPLSKQQPFVWVWMGMSFGREMQFSGTGDQMRITWFADECRGIDLIGPKTGAEGRAARGVRASLRRGDGADDWHLYVHDAGVPMSDVLAAINYYTQRHEYLGIGLQRGAMNTGAPRAFEVEGTRAELLSAVLREYQTTPARSYLLDGSDGRVWVWDDDTAALIRVEAGEAIDAGHEVRDSFVPRLPDTRSPSKRRGW